MTARANYPRPMGVLSPVALEPRLQQILEESDAAANRVIDEHHASLSRIASPLTTDDSAAVARVVDMIEENPAAFALEWLNLTRFVKQMHREMAEMGDRVNGLALRERI